MEQDQRGEEEEESKRKPSVVIVPSSPPRLSLQPAAQEWTTGLERPIEPTGRRERGGFEARRAGCSLAGIGQFF